MHCGVRLLELFGGVVIATTQASPRSVHASEVVNRSG